MAVDMLLTNETYIRDRVEYCENTNTWIINIIKLQARLYCIIVTAVNDFAIILDLDFIVLLWVLINLNRKNCPPKYPADMIIKRIIPILEVLNATRKSATIASTFSITSNATIIDIIGKIHLSKCTNEKKMECCGFAIYDDAMLSLGIH